MLDLSISNLRSQYRSGALSPLQMVTQLHAAIENDEAVLPRHVWIHRLSLDEIQGFARRLEGREMDSMPLFGIPFAIKDNIDLAGIPTTAACADYAYTPSDHATVVQKLIDAGAIPIGKTNLDQFATGLVGVRSPYGAVKNAFDERYISGGSSSGSAVAVARGLVSFALGTDTAGSGRVPAMLNNIIGLKPSLGRLSSKGMVPACRTLDTISIFALSANDAQQVLAAAQGEDAADPYSRPLQPHGHDFGHSTDFRFGVPRQQDLEFHGFVGGPAAFTTAVEHLKSLGGVPVEVDLRPFREVAQLLYEGPWVAERYAALKSFITAKPNSLHPVTRAIIEPAASIGAVGTFEALYRLQELRRKTQAVWNDIDTLVVPSASHHYTIAEVQANPIAFNSELGHYTNFVNLLDLSAIATPTGFISNPMGGPELPWGVTLIAPSGKDVPLLSLASRVHAASVDRVGATAHAPHRSGEVASLDAFPSGLVRVAVCGAHMEGLPLNWQLTSRGARLVKRLRSAALYRLYALPGGPPARPGMVRTSEELGHAIELEVWELPATAYGSFVAGIPSPLGIGTIKLEDGSAVQGFVCESMAIEHAKDITNFGGWRSFISHDGA